MGKLKEEAERLRTMRESERETHWWRYTLRTLREAQQESEVSCPWLTELEGRNREQNRYPVIQKEAIASFLLSHSDAHKSVGPDGIHPRALREH